MNKMVVRVALEIQAAGYNPATAMDIARIAISAMRQPTDAMIDAGNDVYSMGHPDDRISENGLADAYRAMIDEALK